MSEMLACFAFQSNKETKCNATGIHTVDIMKYRNFYNYLVML